ncbi:MAG: ABC transporter permease [Oscillospiraceae bacterium]|nr:ABC transporter permease [Oscillospiraceae bacterium]
MRKSDENMDRKRNTSKGNTLFQALKEKASKDAIDHSGEKAGDEPLALDDTQRTKILSPGRLVVKRFFRNKLALVGLCLLIFMFVFAFLGPIFYPYYQTQIFYKFDSLLIDYASATEKSDYTLYPLPGAPDITFNVLNRFNSYITDMKAAGADEYAVTAQDGIEYTIRKHGEGVYEFFTHDMNPVGTYFIDAEIASTDGTLSSFTYSSEDFGEDFKAYVGEMIASGIIGEAFEYDGSEYEITRVRMRYTVTLLGTAMKYSDRAPGGDFRSAVENNLDAGEFEYEGKAYEIKGAGKGIYNIIEQGEDIGILIASSFVFNSYDTSVTLSEEFRTNAVAAIYESGTFTADGNSYEIYEQNGDLFIADSLGNDVAALGSYAIRRYSGQDTLPVGFKDTAQDAIEMMLATNGQIDTFIYPVQMINADGEFVFDELGDPVFEDTEFKIATRVTGEYVLRCEQITYLMDMYAPPSEQNWFGTDGDGMDILARMMYGGRISLMVGFIVVFLEIIIGVIIGGVSGFFGKWVDTLLMRVVDIFYCIPGYPILIIMGAMFDKLKMDPYQRLMWMMVALGILGWAPIARLVRGQILSLREQEFMHAQEATGTKVRKRIFRHLIPNVTPQLIVTATMGVGSVIIYESTLSFLGLGVRHPLATWGTMINSVTGSSEAIIRFTYIWVPVGFLICLTVIAFNFVGDGLRDAFDPKMKR